MQNSTPQSIEKLLEFETRLNELTAAQSTLREEAASGPDHLAPIYELADKNITAEIGKVSIGIEEFTSQEFVAEQLELLREQHQASLDRITKLVSDGFIQEDQVPALIEDMIGSPAYQETFALMIIHDRLVPVASSMGSGAIELSGGPSHKDKEELKDFLTTEKRKPSKENTQIIELSTPTDNKVQETEQALVSGDDKNTGITHDVIASSAETEQTKKQVLIEFVTTPEGKCVLIDTIKQSIEATFDGIDISNLIEETIKLLIREQHRKVSSTEIADLNTSNSVDRREYVKAVRAVLSSITVDEEPVFIYNHKRGKGAGFTIKDNLEVSLVEKPSHPGGIAVQSVVAPVEAQKTPEFSLLINDPLRATYLFTNFLVMNNDLLEKLGLPKVDQSILDEIEKASVQYDVTNNIDRSSVGTDELHAERSKIANEFREIFNDTLKFDAFVDSIATGSPITRLAEYLLDGDVDWKVIDTVLQMKVERGIIEQKINSRQIITAGRKERITLGDGRIFIRETAGNGSSEITEVQPYKNLPVVEDEEVIQKLPREPKANRAAVKADKVAEPEQTQLPILAKKERKTPEWQLELRKAVGEALTRFEEATPPLIFDGLMEAKKIGIIASSSKMATEEAIKRFEDNGGKVSEKPTKNPHDWLFDLAAVVTMEIQNTLRNTFDSKQKSKQAHRIISECVDSFMSEWKKKA